MPIAGRNAEHFMNQARMKLPGASDLGIKAELYEALREFFEDTNAWTEVIPITVEADVTEYRLVVREGGRVIRLIGVRDHNQSPISAFMPELGTVTLTNTPNTTPPSDWEVKVVKNVVLPTQRDDMPVAPDDLFVQYFTTLLDGVLGRMMGQSAKSYSNNQMSVYHLRRFRSGIVGARTAVKRMNTVGAQTWSYPQGFRVTGQRGAIATAFPRF